MQPLRYLFAGTAVLFVLGVLTQFFLAGMAVFGAGSWATHVDIGYLVAMVPALLLLLSWPARAGRPLVLLVLAALVVVQVQTFLPLLRSSAPIVAALHPMNAAFVLGLGVVIARRGWLLARAAPSATVAAPRVVAASGRE